MSEGEWEMLMESRAAIDADGRDEGDGAADLEADAVLSESVSEALVEDRRHFRSHLLAGCKWSRGGDFHIVG